MATPGTSKRLSEQEWVRHELTIRQLYLEKDSSLHSVMSKMADEHGFNATKSQYETRFKKWGITKNRKQAEWMAVAQHIQHRKAVGKHSAVFVKGNLVPEAKLLREIARVGYRLPRGPSNQRIGASLPLPRGFRIQTPPPMEPNTTATSELPTARLLQNLQNINEKSLSPAPTAPAYVNPRVLLDSSYQVFDMDWQPSTSIRFSPSCPPSPIVPDAVAWHGVDLLALFPPTQLNRSTTLVSVDEQGLGNESTTLLEPQVLNTPYARFLIFQLINNFFGMRGSSQVEVWKFLKSNAGHRLRTFFRQLQGHEYKVVTEKAFECAIQAGDSEGVGLFLDDPEIAIHPNNIVCQGAGGFRYTALQQAIILKHIPIIQKLLSHGADANGAFNILASDPLSLTINHFGASPGALEVAMLLLSHGAAVQGYHLAQAKKDNSMFECLFRAGTLAEQINWVYAGHFKQALEFLEEETATRLFYDMTHPKLIDALMWSDNRSGTILDVSVKFKKIAITQKLLREYGLEVGRNTLSSAAGTGDTAILRLLLEASSANPDIASSAYSHGIRSGNQETIELLEEYGALRNIQTVEANSHDAFKAAFAVPCTPQILGAGLFKAVELNRYEIAKWLLDLGADPNHIAVNKDTGVGAITTLSVALQAKDHELVQLLLDSPDINLSLPPFAPLIKAIEWGNNTIVEDLILAGSPINATYESLTPLILAIIKGQQDTIHILLRLRASVNQTVQVMGTGTPDPFPTSHWRVQDDEYPSLRRFMTPLAAAVIIEEVDVIRFLLLQGADPADSGALTEAFLCKNEAVIDILLEAFYRRYPGGRAGFGYEVMCRAILHGDLSLVSKLLSHNVRFPTLSSVRDVYETDDSSIGTPLVAAIERDDELGFAIFRMLLDADREVGITPGLNPIIYQSNVLVEAGYNDGLIINAETALLVAIRAKQLGKVRFLIERGASVNAPAIKGVRRTPLQAAAETGDFKIVEFLIHSGADVNAQPKGYGGATALQFAAIYGYTGIVHLLLRAEADVNAKPARWAGRTALEGAAEHGRFDTVAVLLNASVNGNDSFRPYLEQAVERARKHGHFAVAQMLAAHDPTLRIVWPDISKAEYGNVEYGIVEVNNEEQEDQFIDWENDAAPRFAEENNLEILFNFFCFRADVTARNLCIMVSEQFQPH
ncbi:ankyrin repeat-containing domain protein [Xylaria longipes]|nr:ankyrin repeat-containing domain protein [Xylaria longipes]